MALIITSPPTPATALSSADNSSLYYISLSATATGNWTDARVDTSDLYFTASDSTLFCSNFNTSSDQRLKENIATIGSGLGVINQLNGVEFDWKDGSGKSYGVIAQEVELVVPAIVKTVDDRKSVNYNALIGFLIQAVKELTEKVERLESGI